MACSRKYRGPDEPAGWGPWREEVTHPISAYGTMALDIQSDTGISGAKRYAIRLKPELKTEAVIDKSPHLFQARTVTDWSYN